MNAIADFLLSFVDFNETLNFDIIIKLVLVYILILWLVATYWVYKDAKSRFENKNHAYIVAFLNLVLQFPFLIMYLLVRPAVVDEFEEWHEGGVNVPIVNFTGENGIEMSFEMRIHPRRVAKNDEGEMKIDISFDSEDPEKKLVTKTVEKPAEEVLLVSKKTEKAKKEKKKNIITQTFVRFKTKIKSGVADIKSKNSEEELNDTIDSSESSDTKDDENIEKDENEVQAQDQNRNKKKKKKKKKNRNK